MKGSREVLDARLKLLEDWEKASKEREAAEHPEVSPEREAAEAPAELEKLKVLLDQSAKDPDPLLPGSFRAALSAEAGPKPPEARLAEMKEAIESARAELKERVDELEKLRGEGTRTGASEVATLRTARDKAYQAFAAQGRPPGRARGRHRGRHRARGSRSRPREAGQRRVECRVEALRLATMEARIALAAKRSDLGSARFEARSARVELDRRLVDRMENRYAAVAEPAPGRDPDGGEEGEGPGLGGGRSPGTLPGPAVGRLAGAGGAGGRLREGQRDEQWPLDRRPDDAGRHRQR